MDAAGAPTGSPKAPKGGAEGATPPEGEGNPAVGVSLRVFFNHLSILIHFLKCELEKENPFFRR